MSEAIENKILAAFQKAVSLRDEAQNGRQGSGLSAEDAEREADAALTMAQKLAAKHSIDLEALRQRDKAAGKKVSQPEIRRFHLAPGPWARPRCALASRIAMSMGLMTRIDDDATFVLFIGFPEDAEMAWQIFTLVEIQMLYSADLRIKAGDHRAIFDPYARGRHLNAKSYKINYFASYTSRIASRIQVARDQAQEEVVFAEGVEQEDGTTAGRVTGALVLASRRDEVERFNAAKFPLPTYKNGKAKKQKTWQEPQSSVDSIEARLAGSRDGGRANINPRQTLSGGRKALA